MALLASPIESYGPFGPMFDARTAAQGRRYLPLIQCKACGRERRHRLQIVKRFFRHWNCLSCGESRIYGLAFMNAPEIEGEAFDE